MLKPDQLIVGELYEDEEGKIYEYIELRDGLLEFKPNERLDLDSEEIKNWKLYKPGLQNNADKEEDTIVFGDAPIIQGGQSYKVKFPHSNTSHPPIDKYNPFDWIDGANKAGDYMDKCMAKNLKPSSIDVYFPCINRYNGKGWEIKFEDTEYTKIIALSLAKYSYKLKLGNKYGVFNPKSGQIEDIAEVE